MKKYILPLAFLSTVWFGQVQKSSAQSSSELCNLIASQQTIDKNNKLYEIESTVNTFIQDINEQSKDQEPETVDSVAGSKLILGEDDFLDRLHIIVGNFMNEISNHGKSLMPLTQVSWYVSWKKVWVGWLTIHRKNWSEDAFFYMRSSSDMRWSTVFLQYGGKTIAIQISDEHPLGGPVNNVNLYAMKDSSGFNFTKITRHTTEQDRFSNLENRDFLGFNVVKSEEFSYQELLEVLDNALNSYSTTK